MNKKTIIKQVALTAIIMLIGATISVIIYDRATINNEYSIAERNIEIPIFVYHDIVDTEADVSYDYMQTTKETFEKQIVGLKNMGYDFITYEDLHQYKNNQKKLKKHSCIITFDDGCEGVYRNVFPIAQKYNIPITMYVITDNMGKPGVITWEQAKEMQDSRLVTIASHSMDHPEFTKLSTEEAVKNINASYEIIESKLGKQNTKIFTYPYGLYTDDEVEALRKEGYIQNLTDNKVNESNKIDLAKLHRCYPLSDSPTKMYLKMIYRTIRYD